MTCHTGSLGTTDDVTYNGGVYEVQVWTTIGLLAATLFGVLFYLGSKIDSINTRIDQTNDRINQTNDRITSLSDSLNARIDGLGVKLQNHLDRHAS